MKLTIHAIDFRLHLAIRGLQFRGVPLELPAQFPAVDCETDSGSQVQLISNMDDDLFSDLVGSTGLKPSTPKIPPHATPISPKTTAKPVEALHERSRLSAPVLPEPDLLGQVSPPNFLEVPASFRFNRACMEQLAFHQG